MLRQNGAIHKPDSTVENVENATFKSSPDSALQSLQLDSSRIMTVRPAYGTSGTPIRLWTNYFELLPDKEQELNKYSIDMKNVGKQEDVRGRKRARIVSLLL